MAKHAFFLNKGGGGGGGGTGGFALIKIEYPEGQEVTVTFDGETTTAPDTSGLWMFGCDEIGTYTIAITGTTAEVEVEITTQGQIESVWISPQVINYALIYYLGNEFTNVKGTPEEKYAISTGGWEIHNTSYYSTVVSKRYYCAGYKTALNINTNGFNKIFTRSNSNSLVAYNDKWDVYTGFGTSYVKSVPTFLNNMNFKVGPNTSATFNLGLQDVNDYNLPIIVASCEGGSGTSYNNVKNENNISCGMTGGLYGSYVKNSLYALGFCKTDDISGLSQYGSDIATILSNAVDLFTDTSALNWMCLNCTGDFMISALSNTNFVNAMNSSPNKSILVANEHWNRFLALLSV